MIVRSTFVVCFVVALSACSSTRDEQVAHGTDPLASGGPSFCPKSQVRRRDMARYLERMKRGKDFLPAAGRGLFDDVHRGDADEGWIEQLADDGITRGCGAPGAFCPNDGVPREQMAAFIVRLRHGSDFTRDGGSRFVDMTGDSAQFAGYTEQLADDGITTGCDPTHFCPKDIVNREQMAAFLMRAVHPGADPPGTGRFGDVAGDSQFAGRIEQAVEEGIMEPCETELAAYDGQTRGNVYVATLHPTDENGLVNAPVRKVYGDAWVEDQCGGPYTLHAAVDVGRVTEDSIEVREVIWFYVANRYELSPRGWMDSGSDQTVGVRTTNGLVEIDENGTPFQRFPVYTTFYGVRSPNSGLVLQHWANPAAPYVPGFPFADVCGMSAKVLLQVE